VCGAFAQIVIFSVGSSFPLTLGSFHAMTAPMTELLITPSTHALTAEQRVAKMTGPAFGKVFTDHMVVIPYRDGAWQQGEVKAYGPLTLDPATSALHYGQAIFEGFKAFAQPDGSIKCFRPEENAARFNRSAARLAMPALPPELFLKAAETLITLDRAWVPTNVGESLYLRPLMFASDAYLGVRPSHEYLFVLFASPAGAYFAQGVKPVTVWISEDYVRAAAGGTGEAKCAGNYAASLAAQAQAEQKGCDQVVWLDAARRDTVEEMGGMNLFFVYNDGGKITLATPELTGTLLPGVTRRSLLQMGRDLGFETQERKITVKEWRDDIASGRMTEVFACGTAAVITPVGRVKANGFEFDVNGNENGPVALKLREALLNLQHGTASDTHGWMRKIC
jgi:branched-chain amino acid aminotransferase